MLSRIRSARAGLAEVERPDCIVVVVDELFWRERGLTADSPVREKILELAIDLLAESGPESFSLTSICERLFISRPLVYHYFRDQNHLMAEATSISYARYADRLKTDAASETTPRARLERWMSAQAEWMHAHAGIAVVLHFPRAFAKVSRAIQDDHAPAMELSFRYNMAVLATLVRGVERNQLLPLTFGPQNAPYDELVADVGLLLRTASVGMSSLGASVWASAPSSPSHSVDEIDLNTAAMYQHIRWVAATPTEGRAG